MHDLAVLITIFNDLEALRRTLASIDEPDYSFTVVVIDGGSDVDDRLDPADYPFHLTWIRRDERRSMAADLNDGIDYIVRQGFRFLARLDAGDIQRTSRFAIQYEKFQESPELVLLGSNALFKQEETGEDLFVTDLPLTWNEIKRQSVLKSCFIHPTLMLRLGPLDESDRYDLRYPDIEDYVMFTRIAEKHPTRIMPEPLLECFMRPTGISTKHQRRQLISGIRHHLRHPRPLNPLWHAYILKRCLFLVLPYRFRTRLKRGLRIVRRPPAASGAVTATASLML